MFGRRRMTSRERIVAQLKEAPQRVIAAVRPEPPKPKRGRLLLAGAAAGAGAMFFLDPARGRGRRAQALDRLTGLGRGIARRTGRMRRRVASDAYGMRQRMAHPFPEHADYNDPTLARKVESELFTKVDAPKDRIVINAENGVITLRGEVDRPDQIRKLEAAAAKIPGVRGVQTFLHLPNTEAPNKAESIRAS